MRYQPKHNTNTFNNHIARQLGISYKIFYENIVFHILQLTRCNSLTKKEVDYVSAAIIVRDGISLGNDSFKLLSTAIQLLFKMI